VPITLTIKAGSTEINYPSQSTDASGFFSVPVGMVANNTYNWRVKNPKFIANGSTVALTGTITTNLEMGLMKAGDCNNDNVINIVDFNVVKASYGKSQGDPGYDDRADLNGDHIVNIVDFNMVKGNLGTSGVPPVSPMRR
jgi:hypothetical protein